LLAARGGNDPVYVSALVMAIELISLLALFAPARGDKDKTQEGTWTAVPVES
jgi:MFS transporter, MHS family, shikimate and dehydroshikimate transport protein